MMNRAAYLGKGPIELPEEVHGFLGWCFNPKGNKWGGGGFWMHLTQEKRAIWCIDINDPNAEAIVRRNRPGVLPDESEVPEELTGNRFPPGRVHVRMADHLSDLRGLRVYADLNTNEERIRQALIDMGWTPPGEPADEWVGLDELEVMINGARVTGGPVRIQWEQIALHAIKHGPAAVRVRKK
jgi:hypothetical protein